jgi:hypothetical protein
MAQSLGPEESGRGPGSMRWLNLTVAAARNLREGARHIDPRSSASR